MPKNPVIWFEIYVQDMQRARSFYESVLQVTLQKLDTPGDEITEMWAFPSDMNGGGASGSLVRMEGGPSGGSGTVVYFGSDDCADEASRVQTAGGKLMKDKFSIGPYGFIALAIDPEGNTIGFHSMK
jgi:predicted enzyme related to lactoylglutathione lyase